MYDGKFFVPKRVTIETIFGCNASCIMCPIDMPSKRKKGLMPLEMSNFILEEMAPYNDKIEMLDFFGLGEPCLDRFLFDRIKYAKKLGFRNIAISTNADALDEIKQKKMLESGIDTVIFSIDGVKKETHESIRINLNFDRVVRHVQEIIKMRDAGKYKTRFIVRFIRQDKNKTEWPAFKEFWQPKLTKDKNDMLAAYDVHSWGGQVSTKDEVLKDSFRRDEIEKMPCHHLQNLIVLADGTVPLCSEDFLDGQFQFGNVKDDSPMEIFNNKRFNKVRQLHEQGKKNNLNKCRECTILYSETNREFVQLPKSEKLGVNA